MNEIKNEIKDTIKKIIWKKIRYPLFIITIKGSFWLLLGSIVALVSMALFNFFVVFFSIFKPPSTATEISYYSADSFFGLPLEVNDKDTSSILKKGFIGKQEDLDKSIKSLEQEFQSLLNDKFGLNKYSIKITANNQYKDNKSGITYNNIVNITTGKENVSSFGISITNKSNGITESIFYNSRIDQEGFFQKQLDKILSIFGSDKKLGYVSKDNSLAIMFLNQESLNVNTQFKIFFSNLQKGLGNDGRIKENTQEAFEYLFGDFNNELDKKIFNYQEYTFKPYTYGEVKNNKTVVLSDYCSIRYSEKFQSDLDCSDGSVIIKITDDKYNELLNNDILEQGFKLKNVKLKKSQLIKAKLKKITELIHENNNIKLNKSYFIDMANYVGVDANNSNQKVLSQQKIDLSYFADKQLGKDYKNLIVYPNSVQNFTQENAKKILQYKDSDDVIFDYILGERNSVPIYKNQLGYSTQNVKYKCKKGEDVIYPDFDSLIYGFEVQDDELVIGKKKCKQIWFAPGILKKSEIKYYKIFIFKGESFNGTNMNKSIGDLYNKDDYRLNYFYHYNKPAIIDSVSLAGENNIISNVDYITRVGLDKKSIIWKGLYLKISSFGGELKDDNQGGFSIKRDIKTGLILLEDTPIRFEIGLLTKLDDEEFKNIQNEKGEFEKVKINNKTTADFKKNNIGKNNNENSFLKLLNNNESVFENIPIEDFLNDKSLSFDAPVIYGEKMIQQYKNNFINDLQKQKKLISILDNTFLGIDINGKKSFTVDGVLKKYLALNSEYVYGDNRTISMDLCTKYKKISAIAEIAKFKTSELIDDQGLINIRKNQLDSLSKLYDNCLNNYFSQEKVNNIEIGKYLEVMNGISYFNNINSSLFSNFQTNENDIYFLYKELLTNPLYDGILKKDIHITKNIKTNEYYNTNEVDIRGFKRFYSDYFLGNTGVNSNYYVKNKLLNLFKEISLRNSNIKYNENIISLLKNNMSDTDKYFLEQEYFDLFIEDEPFVNNESKNKYYGDRKINDKTYFFNINDAFSFEEDIYNKEKNLHELYLNPNIYLYSFFHYTKKYNTAYNINISNENRLMFYPSTVEKSDIDTNYLYSYSDFISLNILNEMILSQYRNVYTSFRDYCYKNDTWTSYNCPDSIEGNFSLVNPKDDLDTLTFFSKLINNNVNKYGYVNNQFKNIALYNKVSNKEINYIPGALNISLDYLYNRVTYDENKSLKIGNFLFSIKITNLINYYKSINNELLKEPVKYAKELTINQYKISFLRYLFAITNKINNENTVQEINQDNKLDKNNREIFQYAILNYKTEDKSVDKMPTLTYEEYKLVTKEIFDYLFTIKYENDNGFFRKYYGVTEGSELEKNNYKYNIEYFEDLIPNDDKKKYLSKYFGRPEYTTSQYSNLKMNNTIIDYTKLKNIISPLLGTGSIDNSHMLDTGTGTNYKISTSVNQYFNTTDINYQKNNVFNSNKIDDSLKTNSDIQLEDINDLNYFLINIDTHIKTNSGLTIDGFISTLERINQCKNFLLENNKILHDALFTTDYGYNNFSYLDKIALFSKVTGNNLLRCNINTEEYTSYINYLNKSYSVYNNTNSFLIRTPISLNQGYILYKGVNYFDFNNKKLVLGGSRNIFDGDNIENTALYGIISKSFNNTEEKVGTKVKYNFIETTNDYGLPLILGSSDNYNIEKLLGAFFNNFLGLIVSNNIALYQGLTDLSTEIFNYSLINDKNKLAYISEFKNLGPFYYLYTNNGYLNPKNGISFTLVKNVSDQSGVNGVNFNFNGLQGMGDKSGINEGLDNISKGYCEQQVGDKKFKCKSYMEFLKGMSLSQYKQELEFLDMLIASKKIVGKWPTYRSQTTGPFIISNSQALSRIKTIDPELGNRMVETYKNRRVPVFIGQCTWFLHVAKDRDLGGDGKDYYDKARKAGYSTTNYSGLSVDEKLKVIQVGDIISFYGWNYKRGTFCDKSGDAGKYGHVALVVGKNLDNKTIRVAQMNSDSLFITDTKDLFVETMCDGGVIHGVKDRYSDSTVSFSQGPIINNIESGNNKSSGGLIIEKKEINPLVKFIGNYDLGTDSSLTKYVSRNYTFSKLDYEPEVIKYNQSEYLTWTKDILLRKEAGDALIQMAKDFYNTFNVKLKVVSSYRSYNYQLGLKGTLTNPKKSSCSDTFCAYAGRSEHQTGLAVDFFETTSESEFLSKADLKKYFEWLNKNAYKYGFHNSYKNGPDIDGYEKEPWHWRYLGIELATELYNKKINFTEYINQN